MQEGKILAASHDGAYVIRLEGDVRLTLSTTIDEYIQRMFEDPAFASVWVDLCEAEGIDSTTLGLLAKLALEVNDKFGFQPAIYSCDPGINRLLKSMGFQRLFELHEEACANTDEISEIPHVEGSEESVRDKVIEAHRTLMSLSEENRARFKDLLSALEHS
ncbi:STAS domain-containing protein [Pseudohalioglobus sediminis]|uniref:STAS domain-containing protein n=1 Tax=Pseudohalioglobus sediminis TaxID=2606449 RepID=A0A5B0X1M8_9GAMM|nr:STAS domain-containing protein [Pseudohalioglobus sediminis]KAA1193254.1 STAS domain-containing protein [Pseudohalioglobus sediminis]